MCENYKKNCHSCKFGLFLCETLKNNKEYMDIYNENKAFNKKEFDFKESFICDNYKCIFIEYPIKVSKINSDNEIFGLRDKHKGKFVRIRPCGKEYQGKTYLGLYLGDLPTGHHITHNLETLELKVSFDSNPAIFVFDLNKIIYGYESWWGIIEKEEDFKDISDFDIKNIWYVKAIESLTKTKMNDKEEINNAL